MPEIEFGSPEWWLARLEEQLNARLPKIRRYEAYYRGDHPLLFASEKFRRAFGRYFGEIADNWMELIVSAVVERLKVEGFRLGKDTAGDEKAWEIWQRNALDVASDAAHEEALINGESAALIWNDERDASKARITIEHPSQIICAYSPGDRRVRTAALKRWQEDDGYAMATLYLPDALYKYRSRAKVDQIHDKITWDQRETKGEAWPLANPLGVVPVVPLVNRPRLLGWGESELERAIPIQDAVNKLVCDLLVAAEFYAFRARWATGLEIPSDPHTGQEIEGAWKMALDRVWTSKDPQSRFGEFGQTDLSNFTQAIEMFVQHIASQTRTPPHYFYLTGQFPSGEALKSAEAGLVAKARRRARQFGESWEEVIRLAFQVEGQKKRAAIMNSETIWGDPETRTETAHADYLIKLQALGVPDAQLWEEAGFSPTQIARFPELRALSPSPQAPTGPVPPALADSETE